MKRAIALMAAVALVVLPSASPAPEASKAQRVTIVTSGDLGRTVGTYRAVALTAGKLEADSGTYSRTFRVKSFVRLGQKLRRFTVTETLSSRNGTLVLRWRAEMAHAGNNVEVAYGSWSVLRGTGIYAKAAGKGGMASAVTPSALWTAQFEGTLRL